MARMLKRDVEKWAADVLGLRGKFVVQRNEMAGGWDVFNQQTGSYWPYEVAKEIADLALCASRANLEDTADDRT